MSDFVAGSRVRFTARFTDVEGRAFDPISVHAMVASPSGLRSFALGGGLRQSGPGEYYVELVVEPGVVRVKFSSTAIGEEAVQLSEYHVEEDPFAEASTLSDEQLTDPSAAVEHDPLQLEREQMLADLREDGIEASDKSLAFVQAAHATLVHRRAARAQVHAESWEQPLPSSRYKR